MSRLVCVLHGRKPHRCSCIRLKTTQSLVSQCICYPCEKTLGISNILSIQLRFGSDWGDACVQMNFHNKYQCQSIPIANKNLQYQVPRTEGVDNIIYNEVEL